MEKPRNKKENGYGQKEKDEMLIEQLKKLNHPTMVKSDKPLWNGPGGDGPQGGVTQSLLGRYLVCPERFRVKVIEGWTPVDDFNLKIEFGSMWHVCEESLAAEKPWQASLTAYGRKLCDKYPTHQQEIEKWYHVIRAQFPAYVDYWAKHPDVVDRTPLFQEKMFDVPYKLPSGRITRLRGKFDAGDLVGKKGAKGTGAYLQENKTKGKIDEGQIKRQMMFDLQTMTYFICLEIADCILEAIPILGVRYNVIRRDCPVVQHKDRMLKAGLKLGETVDAWCTRLANDYFNAAPQEWFYRWRVEISQADVDKFKRECLDPVLENLCDDYEWWSFCKEKGYNPFDQKYRPNKHCPHHYRLPFGIYNVLADGGATDVDEYLATGSTVGLRRATTLFRELE